MLTRLVPRRPPPLTDSLLAFCIVERAGAPPAWVRCGSASFNADGSVNVRLDALPLTGELHLRPVEPVASAPEPGPRAPDVHPRLHG